MFAPSSRPRWTRGIGSKPSICSAWLADFNWAIGTDRYGLEVSPRARLRPTDLIGERKTRNRTLTDLELRAFWRATAKLGEPFGPLYRLLLLTAQRKSEVAEATRSEPDLTSRRGPKGEEHGLVWVIPKERMKGE
jgi:integrase